MNLRNNAIILICAFSVAHLASCASGGKRDSDSPAGSKAEAVPFVGDLKVHRYRYPNGLKLLVVEDPSSPTFAYHTWFNVGSRDEVPGYTGLAHLFEHMMFKGTKNVKDGEFDRLLESAGAEGMNAFTSRDYTAYVQELPKDKLEFIAKLEADRMVNLIVNEAGFKTETEVVQNERRFRNENNPDGTMYQEIFGLAFNTHPYRWPVIGYQEDLDRMTAADAEKFYKSYYSPNHATIVVVGDVDHGKVNDTVAKYYGDIPAQPQLARDIPAEPEQTAPRRKTLKLNMQVEKLLMAYKTPAIGHEDIPALSVLAQVLAGGKSSRLHRALVETGLATAANTYEMDDQDPSLFLIAVSMQKSKKAAQAEAVVLREIQRLVQNEVPRKELERAINGINFQFYSDLGSNSAKARFIGSYATKSGDFELGLRIHEQIKKVTPAQVQQAAKKYLNPKSRSVLIGVPK